MTELSLSRGVFQSLDENIAEYKFRNMYLSENPLVPSGVSRIVRPSLVPYVNVGSGPIYSVICQDGIFNGTLFVVSGQQLYEISNSTSNLLGRIGGTSLCKFAGESSRLFIVRDDVVYFYDGVSLSIMEIPDNKPVSGVCFINGYFIFTITNSAMFYWLEPSESIIDPLNFATAERSSDNLIGAEVISDEIWFLGTDSVEVWAPTGNFSAPFQRISNRDYNIGCSHTDTIYKTSLNSRPCLIWVTDKKEVVLAQGTPSTISNSYIEEFLRRGNNLRAWGFRKNRNDFYILTTDEKTYVFDINMKEWYTWDTYLRLNWAAHVGSQNNTTTYCGDYDSNQIWTLGANVGSTTDIIVCEISGFFPFPGHYSQPCFNVNVIANFGWSDTYDYRPIVEVRWSDDGGFSWSTYNQETLGLRGLYSTLTRFRSLGSISNPGRVFEFRFSDFTDFRLDYVTINER